MRVSSFVLLSMFVLAVGAGGCGKRVTMGQAAQPSVNPDPDPTPDPGPTPTHHKIFLSEPIAADFGGRAAADAHCNADPNKPSTRPYKAMLADGTRTAGGGVLASQVDWVLNANTDYYRADGTTLMGTTTANKVFDFTAMSTGLNNTPIEAWTGILADWSNATDNCSNWTTTGSYNVVVGMSVANNSYFVDIQSSRGCGGNYRLYCVEQ